MTYVQATAAQVKDAYSTVWRHRVLVVLAFTLLMSLSAALIATTPRSFRAGANVLIVNGSRRNDPTLSSPDLPTLAKSTGVLAQVQKKLSLSVPLPTLKRSVTAKPPAYMSGIMRIEYSDSSPDRAAMIANGVADELASYYNQLSTARYDDDLRVLDAELVKQKARIQSIDARLKARGGSQSVAVDDKGQDNLVDQLNAIQTQRALANAELQGDMAQAAAVTDARTRSEIARRDILQSDPLYQTLQAQAAAATSQLAELRAQFTARYPGLPQLQAKVDSLKAQVSSEAARALSSRHAFSPTAAASLVDQRKAEAVVATDRAKVAALDGEVDRQRHQVEEMAPLELLGLEREAAMNEYRSIAAHRGATLVDRADALSLGSVVVIDRALGSEVQSDGFGPRHLMATYALVSLILALGCAFLAEQLNPRLRRAAHIESLYGKPVVATLGRYR